jgi:hypothetical protein
MAENQVQCRQTYKELLNIAMSYLQIVSIISRVSSKNLDLKVEARWAGGMSAVFGGLLINF